jgi:hypothetical protein
MRGARSELVWGEASPSIRAALGYTDAWDALLDTGGITVRCTPTRRTVRHVLRSGEVVFCKLRTCRRADAEREWRALAELAQRGFGVPPRVLLARCGSASVVAVSAVRGRPLDVVFAETIRAGCAQAAEEFACAVVGGPVRRLHDAGLCYRDLYWNHLFATSLEVDEVAWIDVERVFAPPALRRRRWIVKDLAALCASWPCGEPPVAELVAAHGLLPRSAVSAVRGKAARIRAHVPRYG